MKRLLSIPRNWYLLGLVAAGAAVRFIDIAKSSIWHDEGYSLMLAPMGPLEILARTARDVHPPLYYEALHYWMLLFGSSEAAVRGLSAVFLILTIPVCYALVKKLFASELAARLAALFVTFGPFLVRYSQETRMYGMVAFVLALATYAMVRALEKNSGAWWAAYALALAAGLYTHYYSVFIIPVHWLYVAARFGFWSRRGLLNPRWWMANAAAAIMFLPWLPVAYAQFKRVQAAFWIPNATIVTLPNTMLQFISYDSHDGWTAAFKVVLGLAFLLAIFAAALTLKKRRAETGLLAAYALLGPTAVFLLSFARPIYVDRYFVFAAVAFYCLLGLIIACAWPLNKRPRAQLVLSAGLIGLFALGIRNVYTQANHKMRDVAAIVNARFEPGDGLLSGELYTFFDFSYYNRTGTQVQLWSKNGVNGYGESSLIYDRADSIVVRNLSDMRPRSGYVWVIGKTGAKDYFDKVPSFWHQVGPRYTAGYTAAQKFRVDTRSAGVALLQ